MTRRFSLPIGFPFDISDNPFEIKYNTDMEVQLHLNDNVDRAEPDRRSHGPDNSVSFSDLSGKTTGLFSTQALTNTYYIYSFDGRLLAEYDHDGNCKREYIYLNNKVVAEYKNNKYYYYTTDHINSTRVITDDTGTIRYKAYYGPYGEALTTGDEINHYNPKMRFSGKEREAYSDFDYFGARYYNNHMYRFISVDPVMNRDEALLNPQLLNLYAYCRNNPTTFYDPDGRKVWLAARGLDHPLVGALGVHTYILIMPNNPKDFGYKYKWAISGFPDKKNRLTFEPDNQYDRDFPISELKGLYEITPPEGKSDTDFIKDIMNVLRRYKKGSRKFSKYPDIDDNEGNCNSFATSVLVGAGVPIEEIKKIDPSGFNWGLGKVFPEVKTKKE